MLIKCKKGQGATEYIIIVALIAIVGIVIFSFYGKSIQSTLSKDDLFQTAETTNNQDQSPPVKRTDGSVKHNSAEEFNKKNSNEITSAGDILEYQSSESQKSFPVLLILLGLIVAIFFFIYLPSRKGGSK